MRTHLRSSITLRPLSMVSVVVGLGVTFGAGCHPDAGVDGSGAAAQAITDAGTVISFGGTGGCIDVVNGNFVNGGPVQVWACAAGNTNQAWSLSSGALKTGDGKCLDVKDGVTSNGADVQLWDCTGGPNQGWSLGSDGLLKGLGGKCLDVRDVNRSNGAQLQMWDCTGGQNQLWVLGGGATAVASDGGASTGATASANDAGGQGVGSSTPVAQGSAVGVWLTKGDKSALLAPQASLAFGTSGSGNPIVDVDTSQSFQTVDGFGFALTGGSASVLHGLAAADRAALLTELFGSGAQSIGISYLRVSIGASDLSASTFTYDDVPTGQTDPGLAGFSLSPELVALIPILKEILAIQPSIKIIATPWSAPVWMKNNGSFTGGSLNPSFYSSYAQYFVKYIQQMGAQGITISAITPQNEPLNANNTPSLTMDAGTEATFIKSYLGPALAAANLATKIVAYDHNCDQPAYPIAVLSDPDANKFVDGSAFHLYAGDISALSTVHNAFPRKNVYFTEQYTGSTGSFPSDLQWHLKNVIIGSMRNWSRNALEWNLATDPSFGPHTPGGCSTCQGAVTIGSSVTRNVSYYIVAHASKFVPPGSVRVASTVTGSLNNVAFRTPAGHTVLIVENDGSGASFDIRVNASSNPKWATASVPAGAVVTYVW